MDIGTSLPALVFTLLRLIEQQTDVAPPLTLPGHLVDLVSMVPPFLAPSIAITLWVRGAVCRVVLNLMVSRIHGTQGGNRRGDTNLVHGVVLAP